MKEKKCKFDEMFDKKHGPEKLYFDKTDFWINAQCDLR